MRPAERAIGVFRNLDVLERHLQGVINQQPAGERVPDSENFLQRLGGLQNADGAGQNAEDARFLTARYKAGRGGLRIKTTVARLRTVFLVVRFEGRQLSFEAEDAPRDQRLFEKEGGVVDQ